MNLDELLARIFSDQWRVIIITTVMFVLAAELGYRRGIFLHRADDKERKGYIGGLQGSLLGLLGLLLGFSFAMAVSRYDSRRELVVRESNSIGTTWLRSSLLPPAQGKPSRELIRQYVDTRFALYEVWKDQDKAVDAVKQSCSIQNELWKLAVEASNAAPTPVTATYITGLNEMIDLDATRHSVMQNHVPGVVWLLLLSLAIAGSVTCGISAGSSGVRSMFATLVIPLLLAGVITVIADLDRPRRGMIKITQESLENLKRSIDATPRGE